jgi:hypothetical protein
MGTRPIRSSLSALAVTPLVLLVALVLAACGGGTTVTTTPPASSATGQVQSTARRGHLGDAIVLSAGGHGRLEVTAIGLKFMSAIATSDSTVSNVYGVKLRLRNVGSTPINLVAVGANSALFDAGGWRYFSPSDNPKNALNEVKLGLPGDSRVGWVYFAAAAAGGLPSAFHYTAKSSVASAEGDTGEWTWKPIRL